MVASVRAWYSAMRWLSPNWVGPASGPQAVGQDGEQYKWMRLLRMRGPRRTGRVDV